MPTASPAPLPVSECTLSRNWLPITGNWASAESSSSACSCGSPCSTKPRIVTSNSSSGKQRQEAVVGDQRGEVRALVVGELVDHGEREAQPSAGCAGSASSASSQLGMPSASYSRREDQSTAASTSDTTDTTRPISHACGALRAHDRGDGDGDADDAGRGDDPHQRRLERQPLAAVGDHHAGTLRALARGVSSRAWRRASRSAPGSLRAGGVGRTRRRAGRATGSGMTPGTGEPGGSVVRWVGMSATFPSSGSPSGLRPRGGSSGKALVAADGAVSDSPLGGGSLDRCFASYLGGRSVPAPTLGRRGA